MKKAKITVVGSFIADLAFYTPKFPRDGESIIGKQLIMGPGGKGSNAATAAKRSGGDVTVVTKVGPDDLANIAYSHYKAEGMKTDYVFVSDTESTGSAVIEVHTESGQNRIIVVPAANFDLSVSDVDRAESEIASSDVVLLQLEVNLDAAKHAVELAKKHCKTIVFNPAPAKEVPANMFLGVDYFTPNESEAEFFSGIVTDTDENIFRAGKALLKLGVKNVIITLGRRGAALINSDTQIIIPTTDLRAVDTTGAGDAFNGGLSVALGEGMDTVTAIKFANCVSSLAVTRKGSSLAMPERQEADELLKKHYNIGQ